MGSCLRVVCLGFDEMFLESNKNEIDKGTM